MLIVLKYKKKLQLIKSNSVGHKATSKSLLTQEIYFQGAAQIFEEL